MSIELSKALNSDLYPDLQRVDGLVAALQRVLHELKTELIVQQPDTRYLCAVVHRAERSAQVTVAAHERAFPVDFWDQGVQYGHGLVGALEDVGRGAVAFHVHGASLNEMEARFH
jgi:hypothetical protein